MSGRARGVEGSTRGWRWLPALWAGVLVFMTAPLAAGANEPAKKEPRTGEQVCPPPAKDAASAERFVRKVFGELYGAYQNQLPGPRGQAIRERIIDDLVVRTVDAKRFAERALSHAWTGADADQRRRWTQSLAGMLQRRYWAQLRDPRVYKLVLGKSTVSCERAEVAAVMDHRKSSEEKDVVFSLAIRAHEWRLYDVTVDGTSLVQTWRSRFRRVFREGGAEAIEHEMSVLRKRYPCPSGGCRL